MPDTPQSGHDGPYPAPVEVEGFTVRSEWIDYNNHMNVGFYGVVFDQALDVMLETHLGLGATYARTAGFGPFIVESHVRFLSELKYGTALRFRFRLIEHDSKRLHYFAEMFKAGSEQPSATQEALIVNVSQKTGRSADFPDWAKVRLRRMAGDHDVLDRPNALGAAIGIRRKPR